MQLPFKVLQGIPFPEGKTIRKGFPLLVQHISGLVLAAQNKTQPKHEPLQPLTSKSRLKKGG